LPATAPAPTEISALSLHDALPIWPLPLPVRYAARDASRHRGRTVPAVAAVAATVAGVVAVAIAAASDEKEFEKTYEYQQAVGDRSEEHTSELQSRENLVCRLLLEK